MKGRRLRNWSIVTYANKADIDNRLMMLDSVKHYVYIMHDKDGVEPHWHLIVNFDNSISFKRVCELFAFDGCNTLVEPVNSVKGIYAYLTHKNELDKHQYSDDDLYSDDITYWLKQCNLDRSSDILQAMLDGASLRALAKEYGKEFIYNYNSYRRLARDIRQQENSYYIAKQESKEKFDEWVEWVKRNFTETKGEKLPFDN